jgi:hypothetical protein
MQKEYCEHIWCVYCSRVQKGDTLGVDPSVVLNVDIKEYLSRLSTSRLWTLAFSTVDSRLLSGRSPCGPDGQDRLSASLGEAL